MSYLTSGKVYIITNKMGHTVMDISPADQESVTGYKLTNGDNQKVCHTVILRYLSEILDLISISVEGCSGWEQQGR